MALTSAAPGRHARLTAAATGPNRQTPGHNGAPCPHLSHNTTPPFKYRPSNSPFFTAAVYTGGTGLLRPDWRPERRFVRTSSGSRSVASAELPPARPSRPAGFKPARQDLRRRDGVHRRLAVTKRSGVSARYPRTRRPAARPASWVFAHCRDPRQQISPSAWSSGQCIPACPGNTSAHRRRRCPHQPPSGQQTNGCHTSSRTWRRPALPARESNAHDQP
jgi:hypothetical protein